MHKNSELTRINEVDLVRLLYLAELAIHRVSWAVYCILPLRML